MRRLLTRTVWTVFITLNLSLAHRLAAQNNAVAIGSATPQQNAVLLLVGDGTQGLVIPTVTNRTAVSGPGKGMVVFDDSDDRVYYHDGANWVGVGGAAGTQGLRINGNLIEIGSGGGFGTFFSISNTPPTAGPTQRGQLLQWDGSTNQWTVTRDIGSVPTDGMILAWNAAQNRWEPRTATGGGGGITTLNAADATLTVTNPTGPTTTIDIAANGVTTNEIANNAVTNPKIADNAVSTTKIADDAVTSAKIAPGTITATDLAGNISIGTTGTITSSSLTVSGSGTTTFNGRTYTWPNPSPAGILTHDGAGGLTWAPTGSGVTGVTASLPLASSGGTTPNISLQAGTVNGQVLQWNGANWTAAAIPNASGATTGLLTSADFTTFNNKLGPATVAGGDVTGTFSSLTVGRLQGRAVANTLPTNGQVLKWNNTLSQWEPAADDTGSGSLPTLTANQLVSNTGSNIAINVTGDLSLNAAAANTFSITATAGTNIVSAINNGATTGTINSNRLNAGVVVDTESPAAGDITGTFGTGLQIGAGVIAGGDLNPAININTTGTLNSGAATVSTLTVPGTTTLNTRTYTWPSGVALPGTFLRNDGSGNLTWAAAGAGIDVTTQTGILQGNGATITGLTATSGLQYLRRNAGNTAFEFGAIDLATTGVTGILPISRGGTGLTAAPTNGQLPIGNGTGYTLAPLTAGTGINIVNAAGSITISATGGTSNLDALTDAAVATPVAGQVLVYNGTTDFQNRTLSGDISTISATGAVTLANSAATRTNLGLGALATLGAVSGGVLGTITDGTISGGDLAPNIGINTTGNVTAANLFGNGSGITALSATNISSGTLPVARGGTGLSSFGGGLLYASGPTTIGDIGNGTPGQVLTMNATTPTWTTLPTAATPANAIIRGNATGTAQEASSLTDAAGTITSTANLSFSNIANSIQFPAVGAAAPPMMYMFASGTTNTDRMVIGHSPGFPTYGLEYQDSQDDFHFVFGGPRAMTFSSNGNFGVGEEDPINRIDVAGGVAIGTTYAGTAVAPGNGLLVQGRLGIGTTNPSTPLHVAGNGGVFRMEGTDHSFMEFYPDGPATRRGYFGFTNGPDNNIYLQNEISGGHIGLLTTGAGRVGVGTTNPLFSLHVNPTSGGADMKIESNTGQAYLYIDKNSAGDNGFLGFMTGGVDRWVVGPYSTANEDFRIIDWGSGGSGNAAFYLERTTNSVGFGTTTPVNRLDVEGGVAIGAAYSGTSVAPANGLLVEGDVAIGTTAVATNGNLTVQGDGAGVQGNIVVNRIGSDGTLVRFRRDGSTQGEIILTAGTVTYGAFTGSHYGWLDAPAEKGLLVTLTGTNKRMEDNPKSEIVYGLAVSSVANDSKVMGAYLGLSNETATPGSGNPYMIMAVGNGEMWVVDQGQDLQPGDYLISSAVEGHAMKDVGNYAVAHVVARVAEPVNWNEVSETVNGVKHKRISVFFESFDRNHKAERLEKEIDSIKGQMNLMLQELERLKNIIGAEAKKN